MFYMILYFGAKINSGNVERLRGFLCDFVCFMNVKQVKRLRDLLLRKENQASIIKHSN